MQSQLSTVIIVSNSLIFQQCFSMFQACLSPILSRLGIAFYWPYHNFMAYNSIILYSLDRSVLCIDISNKSFLYTCVGSRCNLSIFICWYYNGYIFIACYWISLFLLFVFLIIYFPNVLKMEWSYRREVASAAVTTLTYSSELEMSVFILRIPLWSDMCCNC